MNKLQEEIVDILCSKTSVKERLFFRILVVYKFAQIASMMRANITFAGSKNIPVNVYALNLAESGFSKGRSLGILEDEIFKKFRDRFTYDVFRLVSEDELIKEAAFLSGKFGTDPADQLIQVKKQYNACSKFQFSFPLSTIEGLRSLRLRYALAGIGSTCMEADEIGSVLTNQSMLESLGLGLEIYDMGKGKSKLTKTDSAPEMTKAVPSNMLLFGAPVKLLDGADTEKALIDLLDTGYARRLLFGYIKNFTTEVELTPEERYDQLISKKTDTELTLLSDYFESLADVSRHNKELTVSKDVSIKLLAYEKSCQSRANDFREHETLKKAETIHRYWKALKIAGAYAWVQGRDEILEQDIDDAIELVEESGEAFADILSREQTYVRLAKYIADVGRKITQVELVENLPFYKGSEGSKKELMNLAIAYGHNNGIVIKKTYSDGIEFISGSKLEPTDLNKIIVSYSEDITTGFVPKLGLWSKMHQLTKKTGLHYCNHHFKDGYRNSENALHKFNCVMLDVDSGLNIETCKSLLSEYTFLISTTKRHTEANNRYRILLPMTHSIELPPDEYKQFMKNIFEWLPFSSDEQTSDIARKWESFNGEHYYNDGVLFPCMDFIPSTKKQHDMKTKLESFGSLDALQRWFALNIGDGSRNNMMHRYAMTLLDKGLSSDDIRYNLEDLNSKLEKPLSMIEVESTIIKSIIREEYKRQMKEEK